MDRHVTFSVPKRAVRIALIMAVLVAVLAPVAVVAAGGQFTDDDDSIFESNIEWLAGAGVTLGCNPPTNDNFCPDDNVSRGQMAAFMQRFAQYLGAEDGQVSNADNADMLDGMDPTAYKTVIDGVACWLGDCVDLTPSLTNIELLELEITVPAAGYVSINSHAVYNMGSPTNELVSTWVTLNGDDTSFDGCEGSFIGVPLGANKVDGSESIFFLDGFNQYANTSSAPVIAAPAGTHTIRLCGLGSAVASGYSASLSATWSADGSATVLPATATAVSDIPSALVERLESVFNK